MSIFIDQLQQFGLAAVRLGRAHWLCNGPSVPLRHAPSLLVHDMASVIASVAKPLPKPAAAAQRRNQPL